MNLYEGLPSSRSIRVLSLKKSTAAIEEDLSQLTKDAKQQSSCDHSDAVHCEISVISLAQPEPFDALSYVWGDPSVKEGTMICNGHTIDITINLWTALRQVWKNWPDKRLWVDAICINQNDIQERNQQVTMMGEIYSTAQCVVVWLGESTEKCNELFKLLGQKQKDLDDSNYTAEDVWDLSHEILSRPWFSRAWTLQEIQLARKAIICCGSLFTDFQIFLRTTQGYNNQRKLDCDDILRVPVLPTSDDNRTLFYHLAETSERKASDPRDKIYCLLSLLPKHLYGFIEADYSLSIQEAMIWVSRICIELDEETGCLSDAGLENQIDGSLPTWVLDWRVRHDYDHHNSYKHIDHLKANSDLLRLRYEHGRKLDRTNRKIEIRGGGLGRLQINREDSLAYLTIFPECAVSSLGPSPERVPCWVELSSEALLGFCRKVKQHDDVKCTCLDGIPRIEYPLRNLPRGIVEGDWLWQRADVGRDYDFVLHPVEADEQANFQLVGEAWGEGIRGPFTRIRSRLRHPEIKAIVATFILI
ncbi:heterokaryon incompatibility protein-domain-containing protein [Xylaria castorea]|nr:heterokaryon incompatibility protein-domain-containing protein [Xylaria castorea]